MNHICPVCGLTGYIRCKCPRCDMACLNGHKWHTCVLHNTVVMGYSDHSIATNRCTCKIGDTESGTTVVRVSDLDRINDDLGAGI